MDYNYKPCFIISHKYYRSYTSYIQYYVDNIQKFYPNSLCIIVDNNSKYIEDIIKKFQNYKDVTILTNVSLCKFELGAYKFGIHYLIENKLLNKYDYIVFSQDTFILKNKYDFNTLRDNNISAISFGSGQKGCYHYGMFHSEPSLRVLTRVNLLDSIHNLSVCWCHSFILHNSKVEELLDITNDIIITTRHESEYSERYLDAILFYFNNNKHYTMNYIEEEGEMSYNPRKINVIQDIVKE